MEILKYILMGFLLICAAGACLVRKPMVSVIIFMAYSLVMSVIWILLASPDLAITEAAVGAGVTGALFFFTLKKIRVLDREMEKEMEKEGKEAVPRVDETATREKDATEKPAGVD